MLVRIEEIQSGGLELEEPVTRAKLDELLADSAAAGAKGQRAFSARGDGKLRVRFERLRDGVLLKGELAVSVQAPCKRCLAEVALEVPVRFTLNLVPAHRLEGADDEDAEDDKGEAAGSFELNDVDQEPFDGKTIDLDPIVREQVLLALPISVVCDEECKGLCPVCGRNQNEGACSCERKVIDPRLAPLKDIKLN